MFCFVFIAKLFQMYWCEMLLQPHALCVVVGMRVCGCSVYVFVDIINSFSLLLLLLFACFMLLLFVEIFTRVGF